jgi:type III pantothenate kinase
MSVLIIDIGNTRVKTAVVSNNIFTMLPPRTTLTVAWLVKVFAERQIKKVVLCSVKTDDETVNDWLAQNAETLIFFSYQTPLPIHIAYSTPHTLGKDRLAAVLGAWHEFPNRNTLVIDAGTCIKYDIITEKGVYLGGTIAPGIGMRLRAMHEFTAKLPLVERKQPDEYGDPKSLNFVGDSTETAIRTGAQLAAALEAKGFIDLYQTQFDNLNIVLTGGDAIYLKPYLSDGIKNDALLLMKGLYSVV